jgi:hypothetical protein
MLPLGGSSAKVTKNEKGMTKTTASISPKIP